MPHVTLLVHTTPGLREALEASYEEVSVISVGPSLQLAEGSLGIARTVYVEDTVDNLAAVRNFIALAASRGVQVLLGLHGLGVPVQHDFVRAGVAISLEREPAKLVGWIARAIGVRRRRELSQALIGIGTAKGGAGKTTVAINLVRAFVLRKLKVLLVDTDVANAGIPRSLKLPSGFPSYLRLIDDHEAWSPDTLRRLIVPHSSGAHLLLGSATPAERLDFHQGRWEGLLTITRALTEYDVIIFDTPPDISRRPYLLDILAAGGAAVVPSTPTDEDAQGAWDMLHVIETDYADPANPPLGRSFVLFVEPEPGVIPQISDIQPMLGERFPRVRFLPTWPRAARQLSLASVKSKADQRYISPLDVMPASAFSRAVHRTADALIAELGLTVPAPMPTFSVWERMFGARRAAVPQG